MASQSKVALITGGAGGMGYAMVERLVELGWNIAIVDFNDSTGKAAEQKLASSGVRPDVKKWGRIDLVWANAGIGDRTDYTAPAEEESDGAPAKPDVLVVDIDLYGAIYTSYLAMFFFRKNEKKGGKLVMTSSMAGLYANIALPLYGAAKHGTVGLTRNLALILGAKQEPIEVNCLCPGLVPTGIPSKEMLDIFPKEQLTPLITIIKAMETFIDNNTTGKVAECSGSKIHYRDPPEYCDDNAVFLNQTFPISMTFLAKSTVDLDADTGVA